MRSSGWRPQDGAKQGPVLDKGANPFGVPRDNPMKARQGVARLASSRKKGKGRRAMSTPTTPSEWVAEQVAVDTARIDVRRGPRAPGCDSFACFDCRSRKTAGRACERRDRRDGVRSGTRGASPRLPRSPGGRPEPQRLATKPPQQARDDVSERNDVNLRYVNLELRESLWRWILFVINR